MNAVDKNGIAITVGCRIMWLSRPRRGPGSVPKYGVVESINSDSITVRAEGTNRLIRIPNADRCEVQGGFTTPSAPATPGPRTTGGTKRPRRKKVSTQPPAAVKLINKVKVVGDRSGSMGGLVRDAVNAFNVKVDELKRLAQEHGQDTYLSLRLFGTTVARHNTINNQYIHGIQPITNADWPIDGVTALLDAVGVAIDECQNDPDYANENVSYVIEVITDGHENRSVNHSWQSLADLIRQCIATDRFTFVFSVPGGCKRTIVDRLGVPDGCVQEWEQTSVGMSTSTINSNVGYSQLYTARSAGKKSVRQFFTPDMSQISDTDINALPDQSRNFTRLPVSNEDANGKPWEIRPFVLDRQARRRSGTLGSGYVSGNAYYQLTKQETVQANKDILVRRRSDGKLFGGDDARRVIGMPTNVEVTVKPGNHGDYDIFIKSTSVNRKLVRGTDVLYRKS